MSEDRVSRWIRPEVRALEPYHVPPSAGLVKLDAMENPYPWPGALTDAWLEALRGVSLNRYPDPDAEAVKQRVRAFLGLPPDAPLLLGNGSDELIQMLMLAVGSPGRSVLAPEPGFAMYRLLASMNGLDFHGVPLREGDFGLPVERMIAEIEARGPALVFLASPNNPTGNLFPQESVEAIIGASPGLVVVDEAYFPFAGSTCLPLIERHPHLLVMQTLSKLGLAGLRIGMLAGSAAWLEQINKVRLPYNINVLSQLSVECLLGHTELIWQQAERIRQNREVLAARLAAIPGIETWPSSTNFLLFRVPGNAREVHARLLARGVLIKQLDGSHPLLARCLRVTVGAEEENEAFLRALQASL